MRVPGEERARACGTRAERVAERHDTAVIRTFFYPHMTRTNKYFRESTGARGVASERARVVYERVRTFHRNGRLESGLARTSRSDFLLAAFVLNAAPGGPSSSPPAARKNRRARARPRSGPCARALGGGRTAHPALSRSTSLRTHCCAHCTLCPPSSSSSSSYAFAPLPWPLLRRISASMSTSCMVHSS